MPVFTQSQMRKMLADIGNEMGDGTFLVDMLDVFRDGGIMNKIRAIQALSPIPMSIEQDGSSDGILIKPQWDSKSEPSSHVAVTDGRMIPYKITSEALSYMDPDPAVSAAVADELEKRMGTMLAGSFFHQHHLTDDSNVVIAEGPIDDPPRPDLPEEWGTW